jgi:hypothetical protein
MTARPPFGYWICFIVACVFLFAAERNPLPAVELAILTEENWDEFVPQGKEVDAIYGDYVLRNDRVVAVIARDVEGRNANMTVRNVGGCIIDLTRREDQSDQLSAYYPVAEQVLDLEGGGVTEDGDSGSRMSRLDALTLRDRLTTKKLIAGPTVQLRFRSQAVEGLPGATVTYTLFDGADFLQVSTHYFNPHAQPLTFSPTDSVRVDGEFQMGTDDGLNLFWAHDAHWRQAYGIQPAKRPVMRQVSATAESVERRRPVLQYESDGRTEVVLQPRKENEQLVRAEEVARQIFPAADLVGVKAIAQRLRGEELKRVAIRVTDEAGPVRDATVEIANPEAYGRGHTGDDGTWAGELPPGAYAITVKALGREPQTLSTEIREEAHELDVKLPLPGYVAASVADGDGREIPCKVAFHGRDGTPDPNFGPDSSIHGVRNLWYTADGKLRVEIAPGKYDVVISHGPEYDAAFQQIEVKRGEETKIEAQLVRSVETTGWLSAELHSHSTPSGDNTASQRGRVLNLLAEHLEFIPCTEHNRIDTYLPHLEYFDAMSRVATCSGMELTGNPLPINHQNAFPLIRTPRTQDGGGPVTDTDPVVQIERLALWDSGSDKLVQSNHPHIPQMVGDRDYDGTPDEGFEKMFGFMDVIEVHPPAGIFTPPAALPATDRERSNPIFHWMQLLNIGYRVPGVVNTDAHWNFHGSGWIRNYVKAKTDEPSEADIMDLVHAFEHGTVVMTNGPFLTVTATPGPDGDDQQRGDVGGDVAAPDGYVNLSIRVQCPNWLDVNRVQVFANGRPLEAHDYRRPTHRDLFGSGAVKFDQTVQVMLDRDAHLIVATAGEGLTLGRVMGGPHAEDMPVAVTNPIFVDIDGGGFTPSGDMLGVPLRLPAGHKPSHAHE